jgi:hypothetical protein
MEDGRRKMGEGRWKMGVFRKPKTDDRQPLTFNQKKSLILQK